MAEQRLLYHNSQRRNDGHTIGDTGDACKAFWVGIDGGDLYWRILTLMDSKWVRQIVDLQHSDGSWGCFHTLSQPAKGKPMSTEQALRRLRALGLSKDDAPIEKALDYMRDVLHGKCQPPDRRERVFNWDAFEAHMIAAWIRIFVPEDLHAMSIARMWVEIIIPSFRSGAFNGEWDMGASAKEY
jgi:hypothetical protein